MKIFLSYAAQDKSAAETVAFSLRNRGYLVFLDRDDLPPGGSYDDQIERAVKGSDIFVFLISPDSVMEGRYTLTELKFARQKSPTPNGYVLPVMARKTPFENIPTYLRAVTILEPVGSIAAETSAAVDSMQLRGSYPHPKWDAAGLFARHRQILAAVAIGGVLVAGAVLFAFKQFGDSIRTTGDQSPVIQRTKGNVDLKFGSPTSVSPDR
jgi:TIR domain